MILPLLFSAALAIEPTPLESVLVGEVQRAAAALGERDAPPYYIAAAVLDEERWELDARDGTLALHEDERSRYLDVDLRVGTPDLDNTHPLRGFSDLESDSRRTVAAPFDDAALRRVLWRELDDRYRDAAERIVVVRANLNVKVAEETEGHDFELRAPVVDRRPPLTVKGLNPTWTEALIRASQALSASPSIDEEQVHVVIVNQQRTLIDTEGTRIAAPRVHARLWLQASATAGDGDQISVFEAIDVHDPSELEVGATLDRWTRDALQRMAALHEAPRGEPYSGPVILEGEAAGVFFHEVMGHRVEGHRQKREDEGKTFAEHVGKEILPAFIDVFDDPTIARMAEVDLNGHYRFDDEGVSAARASLVEHGVFTGFLMGRSPIDGFEHSNGHGRRSPGSPPLARMGNTIVQASQTTSREGLRKQLLAEVAAQKLEYGYIVEDIEGGFTMTGRTTPNAFNVRATASWRVWADGRPDELVRGIDLVGTPLVAFRNLIAAGDTPAVFNGTCGAESGWVPVSAVSPPLLFRTLEFQRKEKGQDRAPLLAKPRNDDGTADAVKP